MLILAMSYVPWINLNTQAKWEPKLYTYAYTIYLGVKFGIRMCLLTQDPKLSRMSCLERQEFELPSVKSQTKCALGHIWIVNSSFLSHFDQVTLAQNIEVSYIVSFEWKFVKFYAKAINNM
jgi:hypothetical protein